MVARAFNLSVFNITLHPKKGVVVAVIAIKKQERQALTESAEKSMAW